MISKNSTQKSWSTSSKNMYRTFSSSSKKSSSNSKFTPTQVLINQILKVLKLRLIIENIKIPEEKIIDIIKSNLTLIDIRYLKVSSINVFVDDLVEIIKKDYKNNNKEEKKAQPVDNQGVNNRTTILSFNRKEYESTKNVYKYNKTMA